jgi:2-(1,2-epoxy-1,2-dihydrophenyl)acetyl-CoA isomerase
MYNTITIDNHDSFAVLTLNAPEKLNAMSDEMISECLCAIDKIKENKEYRALVITGAGSSFSSGADLQTAATNIGKEGLNLKQKLEDGFNKLILKIKNLNIPVIAAINGPCAGAGMGVALSTDIVIAAEDAYFLQAFVHIGLVPDAGCTWFLPRLVGEAKAKAMMMLGEKISATEAEKMGLVYKVVSTDNLLDDALELAKKMSKGPTTTFNLIKQISNVAMDNNLEEQLNLEATTQNIASKTGDFAEGIQAFLQKRKPQFKGK